MKEYKTVFDYIDKYGDLSFEEFPFSDVDSLIMSALAYLNYDLLPNYHSNYPLYIDDINIDQLKDVAVNTLGIDEKCLLIEKMKNKNRYKNIQLSRFRRIFDIEKSIQFFALTIKLQEDIYYFSFRGTDASLAGWKEDALLAYQNVLDSHEEALKYVRDNIKELNCYFYIGGHSKGGNLSFYAATHLSKDELSHLLLAYSFDGPGFKDGITQLESYPYVKTKLAKFITTVSIVGILFKDVDKPYIVKSSTLKAGGHNVFTWIIDLDKGSFIYDNHRSVFSLAAEESFDKWVDMIPMNERKLMIDALFTLFPTTYTAEDVRTHLLSNIVLKNKKLDKFSEEEKKIIYRNFSLFPRCYSKTMVKYMKKN